MGAGRAQQVATKKIDIRFSLLSYVSSLYYTAPEALLPNTNYTSAGTYNNILYKTQILRNLLLFTTKWTFGRLDV